MSEEDRTCGDLKAIRSVQNDLLRALNGTKTKNKVSIKSMLEKFNLMSVYQINAQIKLLRDMGVSKI